MAPVDFNPHSCEHCRKLIVAQRDDREMENLLIQSQIFSNGILFDFVFRDVRNASEAGCNLCSFILDDECISRYTITRRARVPASGAGSNPQLAILADCAMVTPAFLEPSDPNSTLRSMSHENGLQLNDLQLYGHPWPPGSVGHDIINFEFFGLFDTMSQSLVYRTKHALQVFTSNDDSAAQIITTRPIERELSSGPALDRLSIWLQDCIDLHPICRLSRGPPPIRLIEINTRGDAVQLRDTKDFGHVRYATLSYCWGGDQPLKCLQSNIAELQAGIPVSTLPATFLDAITVCRALNVSFLWVDALCIVQDDAIDKAVEISRMPLIYGNSTITIAGARSDSVTTGFLHPRGDGNLSRCVAFRIPFQSPDDQLGSITLARFDTPTDPIDKRAWTFQERLLSPRTIEFGSRQTRWICQETGENGRLVDGWRQDPEHHLVRQDNLNRNIFHRENPQSTLYEDPLSLEYRNSIWHWGTLVSVFSRRSLSVETDRCLAISGIAEVFGKAFGDRYLQGIWMSNLHHGLMWHNDAERTPPMPRPEQYQGPSWSWTGVNGAVEFPYFSAEDWVPENCHVDLVDYSVDLVNSLAPYGAIRPGSGRLKLRGRVLSCVMSEQTITQAGVRQQTVVSFLPLNDSESASLQRAKARRDCSSDNAQTSRSSAMLLEVQSCTKGTGWVSRGLVLRVSVEEAGVYQRVATFEMEVKNYGRRPWETEAQWTKRRDSDFNFFKNAPLTIIEIV